MCEWGDDVEILVPMHPDTTGKPFHWAVRKIDSCLVPMITALNNAGIYTLNSCCGHGKSLGSIILHDGRELVIMPYTRPKYEPDGKHDAWWTIHSSAIQELLHRAHWGENPELLYVELNANSEDDTVKNDNE